MQTIFISAYRNFSIRYILYSQIFSEIQRRGFKIVVFLKDNDLDFYRNKLGGENVIFEPIMFEQTLKEVRSGKIQKIFATIRRCMTGGSQDYKNSTIESRRMLTEELFSTSQRSRIAFKFIKTFAGLCEKSLFFRKLILFMESLLFTGMMYDKYYKRYKPSLLIVSSIGYMIDPYFMRAAKRNKTKVVSIIHSYDNPSTKGYRGGSPDQVVVWNEIMKKEVCVFHDIPEKKVFIGGIAHWDQYFNGSLKRKNRDDFLKEHGLSSKSKIILFGLSAPRNFPKSFEVIEILLDTIKKGSFKDSVQLLVRLHPSYLVKGSNNLGHVDQKYHHQMESLREKYKDLVSFNLPRMQFLNDDIDMPVEDMQILANMLQHSDILLTEYSTLMIEGAIFDLPVINVAVNTYRDTDKPASYFETLMHIKRVLATGSCKNAYTFDQLLEYIQLYLADPSFDKVNRKQLVQQEVTTNMGNAGESIGKYISDLISN